jgi:hypothetical protein
MKEISNESTYSESLEDPKTDVKDDLTSPKTPQLPEFSENIWIVDGPNVRDMGIMFTTRMMIVKLFGRSHLLSQTVPYRYS